MTALESLATILVMDVSACTRLDVAGRLRQRRRFSGKEPPATALLRRLVTAWTGPVRVKVVVA
jgi:hypothetical protein